MFIDLKCFLRLAMWPMGLLFSISSLFCNDVALVNVFDHFVNTEYWYYNEIIGTPNPTKFYPIYYIIYYDLVYSVFFFKFKWGVPMILIRHETMVAYICMSPACKINYGEIHVHVWTCTPVARGGSRGSDEHPLENK